MELGPSSGRPDGARLGCFNRHADAVAEASLRAALVQRRYMVTFEPMNRWWQLSEGFRLGSAMDQNRPWLRRRRLTVRDDRSG